MHTSDTVIPINRNCLRQPIPEIFLAATYLTAAQTAFRLGRENDSCQLLDMANMIEIRAWTESLWGKGSVYKCRNTAQPIQASPKQNHFLPRMPTASDKATLIARDGYHCRFCNIPVVRAEVRRRLQKHFPKALPWGSKNSSQHAAFQAMWLQFDHILPHALGGDNSLEHMVITCAPCNFARMDATLEQVNLEDPFKRKPFRSDWDGLEGFH